MAPGREMMRTRVMHARDRIRGFTLIEVMITVSIIALLAMIAYPSYKESVARSRRVDAAAVLLENAQWIERHYTVSSAYNKKADGTTLSAVQITESPRDGSNKYYDISFTGTHDATR